MKGSAVDLSVRIESDVNEVIDIVLVDQIRIVGLGGDVEDAVIVRGIGSRGLAGDQIVDKPVKVSGTVQAGSLKAAGAGDRFVLADPDSGKTLPAAFDGALSDEIAEGSSLVITGSLSADGKFTATDVALEG